MVRVKSVARIFHDALISKPSSYYNYDEFTPKYGDIDKYEILKSIGRGKYSEVFIGCYSENPDELIVIKALKPVRFRKIKREISILQNLTGAPNIVQLLDTVIDYEKLYPSLIFEYIGNRTLYQISSILTYEDICYYSFQVLKALHFCHKNGIMHRDVKPHNIVVDHANRVLKLIDWGLAEYYLPHTDYNVRVASRYFKGPELLVCYTMYDYSLDLWSFGCMFAGFIFKKEPFFRGKDNDDQLVKIVRVLGLANFELYLKKYQITLSSNLYRLVKGCVQKPIKMFITNENLCNTKPEAIDFINKLLVYDHQLRLTAEEAMTHSIFRSAAKIKSP